MDHQPGQLDEGGSRRRRPLISAAILMTASCSLWNIITGLIWENSCGYLKGDYATTSLPPVPAYGDRNMRTATNSEICSITVHFILPDLTPLIPHKYLPPAAPPHSHYPLLLFLFRHFLLPFQKSFGNSNYFSRITTF